MKDMKYRIAAGIIILFTAFLGYFVYISETRPDSGAGNFPFQLGLDLQGGTELVYEADISRLDDNDVDGAMSSLRRVIERRVNTFGVGQPVVQTERAGIVTGDISHRLIVELPGVTNIDRATEMIGETPVLEFQLLTPAAEQLPPAELQAAAASSAATSSGATSSEQYFEETGLTGRYLESAQLQFNQTTGEPFVGLQFNGEGGDLFGQITSNNEGRRLAIFLDGRLISSPVIQTAITSGEAQISGGFQGPNGQEEARELANNLQFGALPVPIELVNTQSVGATLGNATLDAGVKAGVIGLIVLALFLVLWYRLPGIVSVLSLALYILLMLTLFKLIPVTLTSAGIAGFILSVGMAVDANVLIFERIKEERREGRDLTDAIHVGFSRAWPSIRDANISSIISAVILYWMGTSLVKGFALVFGLGVIISMLSAISVTRTYLLAVASDRFGSGAQVLFGTGLKKH